MKLEDPRENRRRACLSCGKAIMALATLCGFCWRKVVPVDLACVDVETCPDTAGQVNTQLGVTEEYLNASRRACPKCDNQIMAAATLCKFCWSKVVLSV